MHDRSDMWIIAYVPGREGWCIVDLETRDVLSGPYRSFADAETSMLTRAFRIAQGWAP